MLCSVVRVRDAQLRLDQVAEFVAAFQEDAALDALGYDIDETGQCVLVVPPNCLFFVVKFYDLKKWGRMGDQVERWEEDLPPRGRTLSH